jgi:5-methylcytosine-specific restriction endonuclease McrA
MTKREVEEYLVELKPKPVFNPSIRKQPQATLPAEEQAKSLIPAPPINEKPGKPPPRTSPNLLEPARPEIFNFRFSADVSFKAKFERLAEVLGVENPLKNMATIIEKAIDISLEKKDPQKKLERRLQKKQRSKPRPDEEPANGKAKSRYIPSEIRERVYARAGHQCEYRAKDGTRCSSRTGLEIEHQRPFAIYRSHDESNLKILCKPHNRFQAERVYGSDLIRAKIDERRCKKLRLTLPFDYSSRKGLSSLPASGPQNSR